MNLAEKSVYPSQENNELVYNDLRTGITYKEALVLALAGNSAINKVVYDTPEATRKQDGGTTVVLAKVIIEQADAIIKQMELE